MFFWDIANLCKFLIFGTLCMPVYLNPKRSYKLVEHFDVYLYAKNTLHYELLDWSTESWPITWQPEFSQIWDCWWKLMTTFFKKEKENLFWGNFSPFLPKFWRKWIFLQKRALPVFKYSNYLSSCKKTEKTKDPFLRKIPNWWWTERYVQKYSISVSQEHRHDGKTILYVTSQS